MSEAGSKQTKRTRTSKPHKYAGIWRSAAAIEEALSSGDRTILGSAFVFRETPEGHDYWCKRAYGTTKLSAGDVAKLRSLIKNGRE